MDPHDRDDRARLMRAVEHSRRKLEPFRVKRTALLRRYAGSEYSDDGALEPTPVNQIAQAVGIYVQQLAGGEPQALVLTHNPTLQVAAHEQTLALNKVAKTMGLRRVLQRLINSALFGLGIARVGLVPIGSRPTKELFPHLDEDGVSRVGQLAIDIISLDSWVHDMSADVPEQVWFCGHQYWVLRSELGDFLPELPADEIPEQERRPRDEAGQSRATTISRGETDYDEADYEPRFWLWDLWLPREQVQITTQVDGTGEYAHVRPWTGRRKGPYIYLYYDEIPDQLMPKAVCADLAELHDSQNSAFRKLIAQTKREKVVTGYRPGHEDDAKRIKEASDGSMVAMRDPQAVQEFQFGGPTQEVLAMFLQSRDLASILGGNLDSLGGLGPQAQTATQDQLLHGSAGQKISKMQIDTTCCTVELLEAIRFHLWHDQHRPIDLEKEAPLLPMGLPAQWPPRTGLEGAFDDFEMQIEPFSLVYRSPEQRVETLLMLYERVIVPGVQSGLIQQAPNTEKLLEICARYLNQPELREILDFTTADDLPRPSHGATQAPHTTRETIRRGAPGMTPQGAGREMIQQLMSGGRGPQR